MKTNLLSALLASTVTFGSLASIGCSNDDAPPPAPAPAPEEGTPGPAAPEPRRLIEGRVLPTAAGNLIGDPGFGLVGGDSIEVGTFIALIEGASPTPLVSTFDTRSPVGAGGGVAIIKSAGGTDKVSDAIVTLTSFQGGDGPFRAQVWVSKSNVQGKPVEPTLGTKGIRASLNDSSPDGEAFDLKPVEGANRTIGGRTWVLLRGEVQKPLPYGGFFVVQTGKNGGQYHIAAPEVVPAALEGASVRSLRTSVATARAMTSIERSAIGRYKSIPPRLVPASSAPSVKSRFGL